MNFGLGMLAQAGQNFLDASATQHGNTFASRTARPFEQFETPWGKGPYWNEVNIPQVTAANTRAQIHGGVKAAKETGLHPLFALGRSGSFSGGMSPQPRQGPMASGGSRVASSLSEAQRGLLEAQKDELGAKADYWRSLSEKARQAPGGDPNSSFGGPGVTVSPLGTKRGVPLIRRPLVNEPRSSAPLTMEIIGDDGYRYKVLNPERFDELAQGDLTYEMAKRFGPKAMAAIPKEVMHQWRKLIRERDERRGRNLRTPSGRAYLKRRYGDK